MTFEKVRSMLSKQLMVDEANIRMESRLVEDLKADSANVMLLVIELENLFDIEVEDDAILALKTVKDVVDYVDNAQ